MIKNMLIKHYKRFFIVRTYIFVSLVATLLLKMVRVSIKYVPLIILLYH